jgi:DNA modification methylase/ParB-like chromosome segregation protein Spo0J
MPVYNYEAKTIPIDQIHIGKRFRKDYADLEKLKLSIEENGLINPVTVTTNTNPDIKEPYTLMAGGRRISALVEMGRLDIPCRVYTDDLNDLELRSIELAENLVRKDLNWEEQIALEQEIHNLMTSLYGKKTSTSKDAKGFSLNDTAALLGKDRSSLSKDLKLAEAVRTFKDIDWSTCKNKNEANKLVKKLEETVVRREMAKRVQKKLGSGNVKMKKLADSYLVGSFFDLAENVPDGSIDLVEIDPPYAIALQDNKKDYNYSGYNEVDPVIYPEFMKRTFDLAWRKMAANSWLICWTSFDWADDLFNWAMEQGFTGTRIPGIWTKPNGQTNNPQMRLASCFEMFFYLSKGSPKLAKPGTKNIFPFMPVSPTKKIHPTERPLELMTTVLKAFAVEGSTVMVPFAGSGVTLLAASECSMLPVGYDLSEEYKQGYLIRLAEHFGTADSMAKE